MGWRRVIALSVVGLLAACLGLTLLQRSRAEAVRVNCLNNFRRMGQFAYLYHAPPDDLDPKAIPQAVPPGTMPNAALPPEQRLSWIAGMLPFINEGPVGEKLDLTTSWDAPTNRDGAAIRLPSFVCPAKIPEVPAGEPQLTQYVGLSGIGADSPLLPLVPLSPRAGCFRYDAPTPLKTIREHDGLSQTLLFGEVSANVGPWIRGGPGTIRGLDPDAAPFIGAGGQFGGNHANITGFGLADGSARFFRDGTDPRVIRSMMTIAGDGAPFVGD